MRRHALLVEEVSVDAVREALHVERPPPQMRQRAAPRRRGSSCTRSPFVSPRAGKKSLSGLEMRTSRRPIFTVLVSPQDGQRRRPDRCRARRRARGDDGVRARARHRRVRGPGHPLRARSRSAPTIPAFPPWFGGGTKKGSPWKINDPSTGKGFESAVAYAVAKQLGFSHANVKWVYTPFARSYAPGKKSFDFDINEISYTPARAKVVELQHVVLRRQPGDRRAEGNADRERRTRSPGSAPYKLGAQLGTTSYEYIVKRHQAVAAARRLPAERRRGLRAEERADRRARRRPADGVLRHRRAGAELEDPRPVPDAPPASTSGWSSRRAIRSRPA